MREFPSLIGKRFGKLTVVAQLPSTARGQRRWLCKCDCGGEHIATSGNLNSGRSTNCGCKKSPDLTGKVFGRLTVVGRSDKRNPRGARTTPMWECRCECGNITYKATDTLTNPDESMCQDCQGKFAAEIARKSAGFVEGTQLAKIRDMTPSAANTSGYRGIYYESKFDRYRAQIIFQRKSSKQCSQKYPPIRWMPSMKKKPDDSWMRKYVCNSSSATSEMVSSRESKPNPDLTIYTPSWTD